MKPIRSLFEPRRFWLVMPYHCSKCGLRLDFYLEDGCEGPRGGTPEMFRLPADHPVYPGQERAWPRTPGGRLIVPVPFVAGGCPTCQGKPPWSFRIEAGCLEHHGAERLLNPALEGLPEGAARFHYPKDPRAPQACGIPIFAPYAMRGER